MLFQNFSFIFFCLVVFALYWRFPKTRLWVLACANALFYAAAGWQNLLLFVGASLATFLLGKQVTAEKGKWAMVLGIVLNIANLFAFKYIGFAATGIMGLIPGLDLTSFVSVMLPIGISFYTFQHISYLVDRRLKALPEAPNYLHFWVYIAFFGHSIAGPIMRGHEFFPQIAETTQKTLDTRQHKFGLALFIFGLTKKLLIADQVAVHVNAYFGSPATLSFAEAWVAAFLFAFQIYYDFSAYSDMAVGIGLLFGYQLVQNFRTPYLSANASEFWTRWHVTLSSWIRDYVYIPLGGNRAGFARAQLNLFLAMLASGLWHGANWTFIFWGAYHGLLLLGQRFLGKGKAALGWSFFESRAYHGLSVVGFFLLVTFGWVLFRAASMEDAVLVMTAMTRLTDVATLLTMKGMVLLCAGLFGLHLVERIAREHAGALGTFWERRVPVVFQGAAYAALVVGLVLSSHGAQDFIYFKF
jgi:alginate O-acetyltransferase complex protein AlgI